MHQPVGYILSLSIKDYEGLWNELKEISTGKPTSKVYQHEIDALEEVKKRYS